MARPGTQAVLRLRSPLAFSRYHHPTPIWTRPAIRVTQQKRNDSSLSSSKSPDPQPRRPTVTVFNDTGAVPWHRLSATEKTARGAQQTFNLLLIFVGLGATGAVGLYLFTDLLSPSGKVVRFNEAVTRIRQDPACIEALVGADAIHRRKAGREIEAYGEASWNRWARNRRIAATMERDRQGKEHFYMHFNVSGPKGGGTRGVVHAHLVKGNEGEWGYEYLYLDVPGQSRIYLEDAQAERSKNKGSGKMFGVRWW